MTREPETIRKELESVKAKLQARARRPGFAQNLVALDARISELQEELAQAMAANA